MTPSSKVGKLFLNKEVTIQDLNKGIEFEVDCDEEYANSEDESYFDDDEFKTFKEDVASMDNTPKPVNLPFAVLKERMEPVSKDAKVFKEVVRCGTGLLIPDKSVVMMHYDAYLEKQTEPFDSTRLRKKPYKFLFGEGSLLPGLELAIKTMKKDELSRFLVSPDYAYGAMGCPPRIPPSAEILYEVEILNFYESKDAIEFEEMTPEDQKKASFEKVTDVYHCEHQLANDLFRGKMYKQAIARYRKICTMLEEVSVANEEEDEKRNNYLLKIYLNLAQCYINVQIPPKAIIYADLALKHDSDNPKALYRMGYALYMTEDYERAEHFLNRAKQHKPFEKSINAAIKKLESKRKQHLDWEKMYCKKMFCPNSQESSNSMALLETDEFISVIEEQIKAFIESSEKEFVFSGGYTDNQVDVVKEVAKRYDVAFVSKIMNGNKINKVIKK